VDHLQRLADRIREQLPGSRAPGGHWTDATMALYTELTRAIEAEGHPRRLAALAVTRWIVTGEPVRVCIDRCRAERIAKLRRRDDRHGPPPAAGTIPACAWASPTTTAGPWRSRPPTTTAS
jgi:hypothetical protein